jgi:myo-inositol-1(or 4)-monophosphatase
MENTEDMHLENNWIDILTRCKNNLQNQVTPFLETLDQPQPKLGVGAGGDPIKEVDLAAEDAIVNTLKEHDISFTLISEESGTQKYGSNPYENYITVDPIDGTTNLIRGIPFYATSIAVSTKSTLSTVHASLVADIAHNITYTAERGKGAQRNGQKITPSETKSLRKAVIGIDLNTYQARKIAPMLTNLIQKTKHIRHLGANALELCHVADSTTDAFVDIRGKLRTTDIAAAWLILKEAGGKITTPKGKPLNTDLSPKKKVAFIASANQKIHVAIISLIESKKRSTIK